MTAPSPFDRPSARKFPKLDDLEGMLLILEPSKIESVQQSPQFGGGMRDRATTDVTVFGPDGTEVFEDMYLSQDALVSACRQSLKHGGRPQLGRLTKVASKATRDALNIGKTPEDYKAAWDAWYAKKGKGGPEPKFAWIMVEATEEDEAMAIAYWTDRNEARKAAAAAAAPPAVNPFGDPE